MDILSQIIDFLLRIDIYISDIINYFGIFSYLIIGLVIFVETGLVFIPFLPGDSILFMVGLFSAQGILNLGLILGILILAAIIGDTCNYFIGRFLGKKLLKNKKVIKHLGKHIEKTKQFYEKHGGIAIIYSRFVPIVRTIAPFIAGVSNMKYQKFISYNVIGGISWVAVVTLAGFFLGNISFIKNNLTVILICIVFASIIPTILTIFKSRKKAS